MKKIYLIALGLLVAESSFAQKSTSDENVGIGTRNPHQSAVLDINSSEKGLLIPRLSINQRNSIAGPAVGLMVFQTDEKSGFYFFDGNNWKPLNDNDAKSVALDPNDWSFGGNTVSSITNSVIGAYNQPLRFLSMGSFSGILGGTTLASGNYNTALGTSALEFYQNALIAGSSPTASRNTAIGSYALRQNISGLDNFALGNSSLFNALGSYNIAIGSAALLGVSTTSGQYNLAIGHHAMQLGGTTGNNNVAIGTDALENTTTSSNIAIGFQAGQNENSVGGGKLYIANSNTTMPLVYGDFNAKYVTIGDVTPALRTQALSMAGGYNLLVKGGILTEKVKVALAVAGTDWADYVFEPEYKNKMMSLEEVEEFTLKNKHLPNVPSADEMVKTGLDVSHTSKMFMEKIEELTLYMIELNKEIKALKAQNEVLKKK